MSEYPTPHEPNQPPNSPITEAFQSFLSELDAKSYKNIVINSILEAYDFMRQRTMLMAAGLTLDQLYIDASNNQSVMNAAKNKILKDKLPEFEIEKARLWQFLLLAQSIQPTTEEQIIYPNLDTDSMFNEIVPENQPTNAPDSLEPLRYPTYIPSRHDATVLLTNVLDNFSPQDIKHPYAKEIFTIMRLRLGDSAFAEKIFSFVDNPDIHGDFIPQLMPFVCSTASNEQLKYYLSRKDSHPKILTFLRREYASRQAKEALHKPGPHSHLDDALGYEFSPDKHNHIAHATALIQIAGQDVDKLNPATNKRLIDYCLELYITEIPSLNYKNNQGKYSSKEILEQYDQAVALFRGLAKLPIPAETWKNFTELRASIETRKDIIRTIAPKNIEPDNPYFKRMAQTYIDSVSISLDSELDEDAQDTAKKFFTYCSDPDHFSNPSELFQEVAALYAQKRPHIPFKATHLENIQDRDYKYIAYCNHLLHANLPDTIDTLEQTIREIQQLNYHGELTDIFPYEVESRSNFNVASVLLRELCIRAIQEQKTQLAVDIFTHKALTTRDKIEILFRISQSVPPVPPPQDII